MSDSAGLRYQQRVILFWGQFGPYHRDRCRALAAALGSSGAVMGLEIADRSPYYAWQPDVTGIDNFTFQTLFPGVSYHDIGRFSRFWRLVMRCLTLKARYVFLCNCEQFEYFLTAVVLRMAGRRVYVMQNAKFDDKPRRLWFELLKKIIYLPYSGALVSGARTYSYLRFLGYPDARLAKGYNSLSVERIRRLAGAPPAPGGAAFADRHFTAVARFLPKKNLDLLIDAHALYRERAGASARPLVICGSGPLEQDLKERAAGAAGIRFPGFLQEDGVARTLATSLALVLPSLEEQWGLVVNEALAMGVPVLVSDNVGARDSLVRTAVNGYVFEPDNTEGLSYLMERLSTDEAEWRRLSAAALDWAPKGDSARFVEGVISLTGLSVERGGIS